MLLCPPLIFLRYSVLHTCNLIRSVPPQKQLGTYFLYIGILYIILDREVRPFLSRSYDVLPVYKVGEIME